MHNVSDRARTHKINTTRRCRGFQRCADITSVPETYTQRATQTRTRTGRQISEMKALPFSLCILRMGDHDSKKKFIIARESKFMHRHVSQFKWESLQLVTVLRIQRFLPGAPAISLHREKRN